MDKFRKFVSKPRNMYMVIIAMLTIVTGLASVSFSFYIDESNPDSARLQMAFVDNRLQSDELINGRIIVHPGEIKKIKAYVMSNNEDISFYKLFYRSASKNVKVYYTGTLKSEIGAHDVHEVELVLESTDVRDVTINLGVLSGVNFDSIVNHDQDVTKYNK